MKSTIRCLTWSGMALVAFVSLGCGEAGRVKVYPVKGRVSFDGKPMVGGGSISFVPTDTSQAGKTAGGEIKEDGTYELTTYRQGDGSMVGEFRVVITQVTVKEPKSTPDGQAAPEATASVVEADRISPVYSDQQNSPLKTKVEAKSPNELNFDLQRLSTEAPVRSGAG